MREGHRENFLKILFLNRRGENTKFEEYRIWFVVTQKETEHIFRLFELKLYRQQARNVARRNQFHILILTIFVEVIIFR